MVLRFDLVTHTTFESVWQFLAGPAAGGAGQVGSRYSLAKWWGVRSIGSRVGRPPRVARVCCGSSCDARWASRGQRQQAGRGHLADGQLESWRKGPAHPFPSRCLPDDKLLFAETDAPRWYAAVRPNGDHRTLPRNSSRRLHRSLYHLRCSRA